MKEPKPKNESEFIHKLKDIFMNGFYGEEVRERRQKNIGPRLKRLRKARKKRNRVAYLSRKANQ